MFKYLFLALMIWMASSSYAEEVYYADASKEKSIIDSYLHNFQNNNQTTAFLQKNELVTRLFSAYDKQVYVETLNYLQSFAYQYPEAVLSMSDAIQLHWDSNYLQNYMEENASNYGKLKFLTILGMSAGVISTLKNPLAHQAFAINKMHVLLPLAGGFGAYYVLNLFNKQNSSIPVEPQRILSLAVGDNYFSYQQKKANYLQRLFATGAGAAGGKLIYQALAGYFSNKLTVPQVNFSSGNRSMALPPADPHTPKAVSISPKVKVNPKVKIPKNPKVVDSMFRRRLRKSDFAVLVGTLLSYYAFEKASYYTLRKLAISKLQAQLKKEIDILHDSANKNDKEMAIKSLKSLSDTAIQLVTIYEIEHLSAVAEYQTEIGKHPHEIGHLGSEVTDKLIKLATKLTKTTKTLKNRKLDYTSDDEEKNLADARNDFLAGKISFSYKVLSQLVSILKGLQDVSSISSYVDHFTNKLTVKHNYIESVYENAWVISDYTKIWKHKFHAEELKSAVEVYLSYYQADQDNKSTAPPTFNSIDMQKEILTSTRAFSRFLAEYIANSETKTYNVLLAHILDVYLRAPEHRPAIATLIDDIKETAIETEGYKNSFWYKTAEGGFLGAAVLMSVRLFGHMAKSFDLDLQIKWLRKILATNNVATLFKHLGIAVGIGAGAGAVFHLLTKLKTSKLPAEKALLEIQKQVTYKLSFKACILHQQALANNSKNLNFASMKTEAIQQERLLLSKYIKQLNDLITQTKHLLDSAPQLQINHQIKPLILPESEYPKCTVSAKSVSLSPLNDDLKKTKSTLQLQLQRLNEIERKRLNASRNSN